MRRTIALAGLTVASLVGGAVAGITVFTPALGTAQEATTPTTTTVETTAPIRPTWVDEVLDQLVADGTLTRAQADKVAAALDAAAPKRWGKPGWPARRDEVLEAAAEALGMTPTDLVRALRDGKTIAQVADDKGVDTQKVIDAIVAEITEHLDEAVAAGRITQAQADARKENVTERAAAIVNGERPLRSWLKHRGHEGRGPGWGPRSGAGSTN